jgi:hypothetical protein
MSASSDVAEDQFTGEELSMVNASWTDLQLSTAPVVAADPP